MQPPIYLDHNATAPILPEVASAVHEASLRYPGNPASQHDAGRQARRALEAARRRVGEILGANTAGMDADQVIFTSGGTEANNLALFGLLAASTSPQSRPSVAGISGGERGPRRLIVSAIEHPSVMRVAEQLAQLDIQVEKLSVDVHGVVRVGDLEELLVHIPSGSLPFAGRSGEGVGSGCQAPSPLPNLPHRGEGTGKAVDAALDRAPPPLVSVMLANNETGVLQPVGDIAGICRQHGAIVHTDATQAVGKLAVNFRQLDVDALTLAAHKFHGPLGVGALIVRHGVKLQPALFGGFQQAALRPGTESVALAIGLQTALELWEREADERQQRMASLRARFEEAILHGYLDAVVLGANAPRLPQTANVAFVGLDRQAVLMALDLAGIACSSGSACASGSSEPSPTLLAMGLPEAVISSSLRFSLGVTTTAADVDESVCRILSVANRLRRGI